MGKAWDNLKGFKEGLETFPNSSQFLLRIFSRVPGENYFPPKEGIGPKLLPREGSNSIKRVGLKVGHLTLKGVGTKRKRKGF